MNTEFRTLNNEVTSIFDIQYSMFDIRYYILMSMVPIRPVRVAM